MALLTMTVIDDDKPPIYKPGAAHTLKAAKMMLTLLNSIEKSLTGKRAKTRWALNIYSLTDRAVIEFDTARIQRPGAVDINEMLTLFEEKQRQTAPSAQEAP
jgi:hypothetical protein